MGTTLWATDLLAYERDGFLASLPALDPDEVDWFRGRLEELEGQMFVRFGSSQVVQPQLHFRWAYDLATRPRVLDAVSDIIGEDVLVHSASIFCKHPGDGHFVPWHQDGHYWQLSEAKLVSAWIALSDSTPASGCMRVVTGTHHGRLPHKEEPHRANMLASGLTLDVEIDPERVVDVHLAAGQMSLHHEQIVHGSGPNRSDDKRIGFAVRYVAPEVTQHLQHHAVILARGQDSYHHYEQLATPPGDDLEQSLERHREFVEALRRRRPIGHKVPAEARS
jgi:non-haem Fe2+, alpha-ketoglutarate-dependent halogenase